MINFLDFLSLHLQMVQLSDNIPDNLITPILYDTQFEPLNYDYDILFIIDKIGIVNSEIEINKSIEEIEIWINNFINQLSSLSKHQYSETELLILKKCLFYKLIFKYRLLTSKIANKTKKKQYIDEMLSIINLQINDNTSAWLAKEKIRTFFLKIFLTDGMMMQDYMNDIMEQLNIAQNNESKKDELEFILSTIQIHQ